MIFPFHELSLWKLVVHAPRNLNRKVPTLLELENEVKAAIPTGEVID